MNASQIHRSVARLFSGSRATSTRVAVEQELFAADLISGGPVAPVRVRAAIAGRPYAAWVSFEPGGQVELSLPAQRSAAAAVGLLSGCTAALAADLMRVGIVLTASPVRAAAAPRYLRSARYDAMERHFDTIGPAGRRMMRSTASTQVCLDWWPGRAGAEQWRVLLLAAPHLAASTARATGPGSRLATWLEVDPVRTAFDGRLLHGDDPIRAYAEFAATAPAFLGGVQDHLSTLFPPVRPRGRYLEVRFPDVRPAAEAAPLLFGLMNLLYDEEARRRALRRLGAGPDRCAEQWVAAAAGTGDRALGDALLGSAQAVAA